jgi:Histidine kinase
MFPGLHKKILRRLLLLALITTPLFGLLGGVPVLNFSLTEFRFFIRFIGLIAVLTAVSWMINILLLAVAAQTGWLKNIFIRFAVSNIAGLALSVIIIMTFHKVYPPQPRFAVQAGKPSFNVVLFEKSKTASLSGPADSVLKLMPQLPQDKMITRSFFPFPQLLHALTINVIILILCELVLLHFRQQKMENENARLRQSNLEAKNNQLKNQLHPHFLFNSLNTLRLLLKKDAVKAETYLLKLADILRVSTTSAAHSTTGVKDELNLCLSYLQMQELRFGDMLLYDVTNKKLLDAKGKLPVFALQLLAENAIKHNAFTSEYPLHIFIDYDEMRQLITVRNKIRYKRLTEVTTQTGLKNLDERYRLLSNGHITVNNNGNEFAVSIKIL